MVLLMLKEKMSKNMVLAGQAGGPCQALNSQGQGTLFVLQLAT